MNVSTNVAPLICLFAVFWLFLIIFLAFAIRVVQPDKRLSVYRLGRYIGDKGPGVVLLIPIVDRGVMVPVGTMMPPVSIASDTPTIAETRTTVFTDGKVFFNRKEWDAISQSPIPAGQKVRVVRTILEVERE